MTFKTTRGDDQTLRIPLVWDGLPFVPGAEWAGIFTAKYKDTDADEDAVFQHASGGNLSFAGTDALVKLNRSDTDALGEVQLICDIQVQHSVTGALQTVAKDVWLRVAQDVTRKALTSVPPNNTATPMPFGASIWGGITGNLVDQVDLGAALALKAPLANPSFTGNVSASGQFIGAGTGLTGTAAGLTSGAVTSVGNLTGPVTSVNRVTAIANGAISNAMLANGSVANLSGTNTGDQTLPTLVSLGAVPTSRTVGLVDLSANRSLADIGAAPLNAPSFSGTVSTSGSFSGQGTSLTGTAAGLTAGNTSSIGNLSGVVTSLNRVTAIADGALSIAKTSGLQSAINSSAMNLVWEGDSILAAYNIPALTAKLLSYPTPEITNYAVSGQTVATMVGQYATEGRSKSPAITGRPGIFFIAGGTNDIGPGGATAATIYNNLKSIWAAALADGYKVVACTVHTNLNSIALYDAIRVELNGLIKSDQTIYTYLVDLDQILGRGTPTYYLDHVHPTAKGARAMATAIANNLVGGSPHSGGLVLGELVPKTVTDTDYVLNIYAPSVAFGSIRFDAGCFIVDQSGHYEFTGFVIGNGVGVLPTHWFLFGVEVLDAVSLTTKLYKGDYKTGLNSGSQAVGFNFAITINLKKGDRICGALVTTAPSFVTYGGIENGRLVAKQIKNPEIVPY